MYEEYTDRARRVLKFANSEAHGFHHDYVCEKHLILGLIKEGSGIAVTALKNLRVDLSELEGRVRKSVIPGPEAVSLGKLPLGKLPLTFGTKRALNMLK